MMCHAELPPPPFGHLIIITPHRPSHNVSPPALSVFTLFTGNCLHENRLRSIFLRIDYNFTKDHHRTLLCPMLKRPSEEAGPSHWWCCAELVSPLSDVSVGKARLREGFS